MTSIAILEAVNTTAVQFHGQSIITAMIAGVAYVAMKPIVDNLGMSWTSQHRKLVNSGEKYGYAHMSIPSKGGIQEMLCLPLKKLNGWLFSINPEKVRADIRDKLIQYQDECFTALHDYWNKGVAVNPRKSTTEERTSLRDAVNLLVSKRHLMYPEAYALIHQRFQVTTLEHLTTDQIAPAVEYVHRVILEGELLERQNEQLSLPISYPMEYFDQYRWMNGIDERSLSAPWRYPVSLHANGDAPNPLGKMLNEMHQMGYEVDAALFQLSSLQHHLTAIRSKLRRIQAEVR